MSPALYSGPLAAACMCAAPLLALAAFDIDGARPLRGVLNRAAGACLAVAIAAWFF